MVFLMGTGILSTGDKVLNAMKEMDMSIPGLAALSGVRENMLLDIMAGIFHLFLCVVIGRSVGEVFNPPDCVNRLIDTVLPKPDKKFGAYCKNKCGMNVSRAMGAALTDSQVKSLLDGKKILVKGLKGKKGSYDAYLIPEGVEDCRKKMPCFLSPL